jgi:signal transduction histidine kinase/CheY-like chemotaxis protein
VVLQAAHHEPGVLLYTPVYPPGDTPETATEVRGFLVVSLMTEKMLAHIVQELVPYNISVRIRDKTAGTVLFGEEPAASTLKAARDTGQFHRSRLMAGQQVWEVEAWPTPQSLAARQTWLTWLVLVSGLIGTSLAVSYALASTGRRQHLERAIARHTRTLRERNAELEDARHAADRANTAKSQFLANMSHEIRTPMNAVLGMADLLQGTELDTHQQQCLQVIRLSGQALLSIINDILDHSKIEAGKMEVEQIDMDLEALLLECASIFSLAAEQKHLEFMTFIEPGTPIYIQADPTRLRQILLNLLSNAFKFTDHGRISLRVRLDSIDNEPCLFLEVRDTGIGMTPAQSERLFQAFSQADTSTTRQFGGTGLGLSISKRLLDLMQGEIRLESRPGGGSAFTVRIPYRPASAAYIHGHYIPLAPLHGLRILFADTQADFRQIMAEQAHGWGMLAETTASAADALALARAARDQEHPYDFLLLDLTLPPEDDALPALLRDPDLARRRTIALGTLAHIHDTAAGTALVMARPPSSAQLRDTLLQLAAPDAGPAVPRPAATHNPLAGRRVLVVEDNAVNRMVILGMLKKFDVIADIAANGQEAVNIHCANPRAHDLILMDCEMPVMDGYEASRVIRRFEEEEGLPRTGIIALTAHALRGQQTRCLDAGMDECLIKPLSLERMKQMLLQRLPPPPA